MTLEKVYQKDEVAQTSPIHKLIKQTNPFKTAGELYTKAGLSPEEISEFQKSPDNISIKNLNKILNLCEFDMKLTAMFGEDMQELNLFGNAKTAMFSLDEISWEGEETDWEEDMEDEL